MKADQPPSTTVGIASAQNPDTQQRFTRPTLLHHDAGPYHLAVLRIAVFSTLVPRHHAPPDAQPGAPPVRDDRAPRHHAPRPPGRLLAGPPGLLVGFQVAALVGCVACILGLRPFLPIALTTVGLLLLLDGAAKGIGGYTNHAQMAILYTALIVAVFPAANAWSVDPRRRGRSNSTDSRGNRWLFVIPMQAAALVLATTYSFIGTRRLIWGGPEVVTGESTTIWLVTRSLEYAAYSLDLGLRTLDTPMIGVVVTIGMFVTSVFELLTPLALVWRRFRLVWLAVIVPFHVATLVTMNIFFWENLLLIAILFTGLTGWIVQVRGSTARGRQSLSN